MEVELQDAVIPNAPRMEFTATGSGRPGWACGARNLSSILCKTVGVFCRARALLFAFVAVFCASAFSSSAFAQTCPLCYEQASQSGARTVHAINLGILTLLIPTLLMFVGVLVFAVRRANSHQ